MSTRPRLGQQRANLHLQYRQQFPFEPRVAFEPRVVPPAGVRQRQDARRLRCLQNAKPVSNRLIHRLLSRRPEVPGLCKGADAHDKFNRGHQAKEPGPPGRRTLLARRQVAAMRIKPGKAEAHREDRNAGNIIEFIAAQAHPRPQTISARIVKREAAFVCTLPGRLACDAQPRGFGCAKEGARLGWHRGASEWVVVTDTAGTRSGDKPGKIVRIRHETFGSAILQQWDTT
jgi:hypothetical protein